MRLVYFYTSNGCLEPGGSANWNPQGMTGNFFAGQQITTEGFYYLFRKLIEYGILEEVLIVIDSMRSPGMISHHPGIKIRVVPHVDYILPYLRDDDIFYVRGGFKPWYEFLSKQKAAGRWMMFYRAATNRGNWPFWDVILEDLTTRMTVDNQGRITYPIVKPTNPEIFYTIQNEHYRTYDLCIGASHIHDKKGQWRTIDALVNYRKIYGENLHCIMPGSFHHSVHTNEILDIIAKNELDVAMPGMIDRRDMRSIYSSAKLYVHLATSGQNDRGVLESLCCGTPAIIGFPNFHPVQFRPPSVRIATKPDDPVTVAYEIHSALADINRQGSMINQMMTKGNYESFNGLPITLNQFIHLLCAMQKKPAVDRAWLYQHLLKNC